MNSLLAKISERLQNRGWRLATAESCTGGLIAKLCTDLPGSSQWFECGWVTYSNRAKMTCLAVNSDTLNTFGAVSEAVAREMAEGALSASGAQLALSVTGIAGPDGGTLEKPVGLVWFAWASTAFQTQTAYCLFEGDRNQIRHQAASFSLQKTSEFLKNLTLS